MNKNPFIEIDGKMINIEHIIMVDSFEKGNEVGILLDSGDYYRANISFCTIKDIISNYYKRRNYNG